MHISVLTACGTDCHRNESRLAHWIVLSLLDLMDFCKDALEHILSITDTEKGYDTQEVVFC